MIYQGRTTSQWIEALKSNDPGLRVSAAWALGEIGPEAAGAVPLLIEAFRDQHPAARWNAVEAVGKIGPTAAQAVPPLIEALKDPEAALRWRAAWSLGKIGPAASAAAAPLAAALQDEAGDVRARAAQALGGIGAAAAVTVPNLITALGDQDWQVRMYAASSLGALGAAARPAVSALTQALNDPNEAVRWQATEALKAIQREAGEPGTQQPVTAEPPTEQQPAEPAPVSRSPGLRGRTMVILAATPATSGKIKLQSEAMHSDVVPLRFELRDDQNRLLERGTVTLGGELNVSLPAGGEGHYLLRLDAGLSRCFVTTDTPHAFLASDRHRLRINQFEGDLYFPVPEACEEFELRVACEAPNEGAAIQAVDPEGSIVGQVTGEIDEWTAISVRPAPELCGKPWRLNSASDATTALEDVGVYLSGDVAPLVSRRPEWAAAIAPLMATLRTEGD